MGSVAVTKLTGFTGAEVTGIELTGSGAADCAERLRGALAEHHVLVLPGLNLSPPEQKILTEVFGRIMRLPYVAPMANDADMIAVLKEAAETETGVFGGDWHSDFSFLENPPAGSILAAVELPPVGGDTVWSNQVAAYRSLPPDLRSILDGRRAVHVGAPYGVQHAPTENLANASMQMSRGDPAADREVVHPAVIVQPDTGEASLFLNPIYTTRLEGMTAAESEPYLAAIYRHACLPDFSYRHRWRLGDVVIWNNRTTLHYATNDYDGHRRLLHRTTFEREAPC